MSDQNQMKTERVFEPYITRSDARRRRHGLYVPMATLVHVVVIRPFSKTEHSLKDRASWSQWRSTLNNFARHSPKGLCLSKLHRKWGSVKSWRCGKSWPLTMWSVYQPWPGRRPLSSAIRLDLQTTKNTLLPLRRKRLKIPLTNWIISGCCGTHQITAVRIKTKGEMRFCDKSTKVWAQIGRVLILRDKATENTIICQLGLRHVGEAILRAAFRIVAKFCFVFVFCLFFGRPHGPLPCWEHLSATYCSGSVGIHQALFQPSR